MSCRGASVCVTMYVMSVTVYHALCRDMNIKASHSLGASERAYICV
jgi:hypothetical protein